MNYKQMVTAALNPLGIPVSFDRYNSAVKITDSTVIQYITFRNVLCQDCEYSDNVPIAMEYHVQVDLWTKNMPVGDMGEKIISLMLAVGWKHETSADSFEDDTGMSHSIIGFYYMDPGDLPDLT